MLQIYTEYSDDYVISNDSEFNTNTYSKMLNDKTERYKKIITEVEGLEFVSDDKVNSKITGQPISLADISTGCKTILNIVYNPDKVISVIECGMNYAKYIYKLDGRIYMPYFLPPYRTLDFGVVEIELIHRNKRKKFNDIIKLEWWYYEQKYIIQ